MTSWGIIYLFFHVTCVNVLLVCANCFLSSGERVYDIAFWKSELNNEVIAMANEIDNLKVTTINT